jgi:hypothetical protein
VAEQEIVMTPMTRVVAMLGVLGAAVVGTPALAGAGSATLYELTENMKVVQKNTQHNSTGRRVATSALTGVAQPGTPLCPSEKFKSGPAGCAINVLGSDNISLATGLGTLSGSFATVIQGDNPVDGPEAVALRGEFRGQMDFSPAIVGVNGLPFPYGTVIGTVRSQGHTSSFTGVFRLPFAGNVELAVAPGFTMTLRQIFCPLSPTPNPTAPMYGGIDLAYLDFDATQAPNGHCLDIQPTELSLGAPLVRFDIDF